MSELIAYHNSQAEKDAILAQLARHRKADQLVKGKYWENGKGCAGKKPSRERWKVAADAATDAAYSRMADRLIEILRATEAVAAQKEIA